MYSTRYVYSSYKSPQCNHNHGQIVQNNSAYHEQRLNFVFSQCKNLTLAKYPIQTQHMIRPIALETVLHKMNINSGDLADDLEACNVRKNAI